MKKEDWFWDWFSKLWRFGWILLGIILLFRFLQTLPFPENFLMLMFGSIAWLVIHNQNEEIEKLKQLNKDLIKDSIEKDLGKNSIEESMPRPKTPKA